MSKETKDIILGDVMKRFDEKLEVLSNPGGTIGVETYQVFRVYSAIVCKMYAKETLKRLLRKVEPRALAALSEWAHKDYRRDIANFNKPIQAEIDRLNENEENEK